MLSPSCQLCHMQKIQVPHFTILSSACSRGLFVLKVSSQLKACQPVYLKESTGIFNIRKILTKHMQGNIITFINRTFWYLSCSGVIKHYSFQTEQNFVKLGGRTVICWGQCLIHTEFCTHLQNPKGLPISHTGECSLTSGTYGYSPYEIWFKGIRTALIE